MRFVSLLSVCFAAFSFVSAAPQGDDTDVGEVVYEDGDGPVGIVLPAGAAEGLYEYNTTTSTPKFTSLAALGVVISRSLPVPDDLPTRTLTARANSVTHCFSAEYDNYQADAAVVALGNIIRDRGGYVYQASFAVVVGSAVQYICNRVSPKEIFYDWWFPGEMSKSLDGKCGRPKAARFDRNDGKRGFGRTHVGKPFCN
ncbi:hypothetical protein EXIGLDRAFT_721840, partial [Exidia glandulosa HHB12029]